MGTNKNKGKPKTKPKDARLDDLEARVTELERLVKGQPPAPEPVQQPEGETANVTE